jgi:hypothetical protein
MCFELWRDDDAEGATCVSRGDTRPSLDWSYVALMTGSLKSLWSLRKAGNSSAGDGTFVDAVEGYIRSVNSLGINAMLKILPGCGSLARD